MNDGLHPSEEMTLDPPGSIAVVGAGALGIEAGLYGRYLGYDVIIMEAGEIGQNLLGLLDTVTPVLPDQCMSPLALSALKAQAETNPKSSRQIVLPTTVGQWVQQCLVPLANTDLLRGRVSISNRVTMIKPIPVLAESESETLAGIPPDFELSIIDDQGKMNKRRFESVILATGTDSNIELGVEQASPYFFQIGDRDLPDDKRLIEGRHQIVKLYAQLAGRFDLDLYRPRRI